MELSLAYFPLDSQAALQDLASGCPTKNAAAIAHLAPTRAQILSLDDILTLALDHPNFLRLLNITVGRALGLPEASLTEICRFLAANPAGLQRIIEIFQHYLANNGLEGLTADTHLAIEDLAEGRPDLD